MGHLNLPTAAQSAPPGPQALLAEDETTGCIAGGGQHDSLMARRAVGSGGSIPGRGNPVRLRASFLPEQQAQLGRMFLNVAHTVEL